MNIDGFSWGFPPPPDGLSARSQILWNELGPRHAQTLGRRLVLEEALRARDRAESARLAIAAAGLTTAGNGRMQHAHPFLKVEAEARRAFVALASQLGLET